MSTEKPKLESQDAPKKRVKKKEDRQVIKKKRKAPIFSFKGLDGKRYTITRKQKIFADYWLDFNNTGTDAAIKAGYGATKGGINRSIAASIASENLRKLHIINYITWKLKECGMTDELVEKHHLITLTQLNDLGAKNRSIDMFYKLRGKYPAEKHKVETEVAIVEIVKYAEPKDKN